MKIAIMCSLDFAQEVGKIKSQLEKVGFEVSVPFTLAKILAGELTQEKILEMKRNGTIAEFTKSKDLIRMNWDRLKQGVQWTALSRQEKWISKIESGG